MALDDMENLGRGTATDRRKWWTVSVLTAIVLVIILAIFLTHAA